MLKKILFLSYFFVFFDVFASTDCSKFKFNPDIKINHIDSNIINVEESEENLVNKFGYVESSIGYNTKYMIIPILVKDGFCLSLRSVDVNITFPEFNVVIDKRLKKDSCAYNVVLKHEKDHIEKEKETINSNLENIKKAVLSAALSIEPVFAKRDEDIQAIEKKMFEKLKEHKDIVEIIKKVKDELSNENEEIDVRGDSWEIWQCEDFFEEMKNSYANIPID